jgi:NADPH-dependent 2,4-dienoyl-CoA reductase/sulfur reductase-like enzyme
MPTRHLIVGAGPAGLAAVETLRALDPACEIALVCDEPPYARMVLPYLVEGRIEERATATGDAEWLASRGVEAHLGRRVQRIEPAAHRVTLDDGVSLGYDRLLIATGSRAARPALPGIDLPGVLPFWTLDHARAYLGAPHRETAIVGGGFIAFTVLDAVVARSERVTLLEREPQVLPRMLDASGAAIVAARLRTRGVDVRTEASLERIEAHGGRKRLHLADGAPLECDAVLVAAGIQPNVELLDGSGIEVRHGVVVDEHLRTSAADVFAAGDVAEGPDLLGGTRSVRAIQPTAVDHGRVAAANMAGHPVAYAGSLVMNVLAVQGLEAASFGRWDGAGDATVVGSAAAGIHRKYVWDGERMIGGVLVGPNAAVAGTNDVGMLKGLIQTGVALGPWRAWLEENPLELRRAFLASGAAQQLLGETLLTGRAATGGGFRWPQIAVRRPRSPHHATLVTGAPR